MRVNVRLVGTTPLVVHNVQLADPDNDFAKAIAVINAKASNMTEVDRREKARLQWFGALYVSHNGHAGPVMPTANIRRCFRQAGTATRQGKSIERAVIPLEVEVPLVYDGPREITELFKQPEYVWTTMVSINRGKVQSTRPIFHRWQVDCQLELVTELLDFDRFRAIVEQAGIVEGLGDGRVIGYGRFKSDVKKA